MDLQVEAASAATDPLGRALHLLRMTGVIYSYSYLHPPLGIALPPLPGCFMFHAVTAGECWLRVPGAEPVLLRAGDFALVPRGEGHDLLSTATSRADDFFDLPRVQLGGRFEILRHGEGSAPVSMVCGAVRFDDVLARRLVHALPRQIVLGGQSLGASNWLAPILALLQEEVQHLRPGGEAVATRLADVLVLQAIRTWLQNDPGARTGWLGALQDAQLGPALVLMHEQPGTPWTLASLASAVAMSRSAFAARFAASVGMPVMQYLTLWRMALAQSRLQEGQVRLAELADSLGYQSEAAFSRAYKRWSGRSPGSERRVEPAAALA